MGRAPYQVLVFPYRKGRGGEFQFAAFKRSDTGEWQGIAGGGECGETPEQAARRESFEEAAIPTSSTLVSLQTQTMIPVRYFSSRYEWPDDLYVIPEYSFGIDCTGIEFVLSTEHTEVHWDSYNALDALLKWDSNRTALWELNERLKRTGTHA